MIAEGQTHNGTGNTVEVGSEWSSRPTNQPNTSPPSKNPGCQHYLRLLQINKRINIIIIILLLHLVLFSMYSLQDEIRNHKDLEGKHFIFAYIFKCMGMLLKRNFNFINPNILTSQLNKELIFTVLYKL